jgi:hypothetical protein
MELTDKLKLKNNITIHMKNKDDGFITDCENGDVYEINETSKLIIDKCDGDNSLKEILDELIRIEGGSNVDKQDMIEFATFLVENNICESILYR